MSMHQHLSRHLARSSNGQTAETKSPQRTTASRKATVMWAALAAGFLAIAIPHVAQAAVSEDFSSIFGTSYSIQTASGWRIDSGMRSGSGRSGFCARLASTGANNYLQYQGSDGNGKDGGVGNISFWYRAWDQSPQPKFKVQYSVNGGSFSDIGSEISPTVSYAQFSHDLNNASDNIIVRIQQTAGERIMIDDASIADYAAASGIWINPMSAGKPMATYYLGDTMGSWNVNFEIGQASWDYAQVGIGPDSDGLDYSWGEAAWYEDGTAPNKRVRRDLSGYKYTSVGSHYVICQAKANSGDTYTSKSGNGWGNPVAYPPVDLADAYFTCSALNNPGSQSATAASASQINLSWTRGTSGTAKDTVIFRSTSSTAPTLTGGTAYSQGSTYNSSYYCVYKGSGTSHNDSASLSSGTRYYYYFYAVNNDYYSSGVTANATTYGPPVVSTTSATPGTPADPTQANAAGNVTANGGSTVTERGIVWNTTGAPTTANNKVAHASSGTGSFSVTLTGLTPGQTIHYNAYAINNSGTGYGTASSFDADCFTTGPVIGAASAIGATGFTANWESVAGASSYRLDVSTNATFSGGGGGGLLISQYIETDSGTTPKGIEIWNATGADITFDGSNNQLDIKVGVNGALPTIGYGVTVNSGTLAAGAVWVIGTADMSPDVTKPFTFNGDDSIVLELGGVVQDVFGNPGSRPSTSWDGNGVSTADQNIQLKSGITTGDTVGWTDPSERFEYVANGSTLTGFGTAPSGGAGGSSYVTGYEDLTVSGTSQAVTGLTVGKEYFYRVRAVNTYCTSDDSETTNVTTVANTPTISASGTPAALSTTYGTASGNTSFNVSGANMGAGITVTPPSGFEVSTSSGSGFASSIVVGAAGTINSTAVYLRLAATTAVGSYSGNIALSSAGATSVNVATTSSTVGQKALTITGLSVVTKTYDGSTAATLSGTAAYSGLMNGDSFSVSGTPSASFNTKHAGSGKDVTVTGYTAPSGNYSITQPTGLTGTITAQALTLTGQAASKVYDGGTSSTTPAALTGAIQAGDTAPTWAQTYNNKHVGTSKTLTPSSLKVDDGNSGNNYSYTYTAANVGTISKRALTITAATDTKTYNGTATSAGTPTLTTGAIQSGDSAPTWTQTFDSPNAGNRTLTPAGVVSDGNSGSNYSYTYATAVGTINKAASTVSTWPTATEITEGQPLSYSTLSGGSSSPAGSFAFTTPTDTPAAGTANQSVTFTPTDAVNYSTVVGSVSVKVNEATCVPGEVVLTQQTGNYGSTWGDGGGTFDNGATEVGMWANQNAKQVVSWRNFRTDGGTGGAARELQPGDRFRIQVYGTAPNGTLGVSLNDGAATGSWANRISNSRGYVQVVGGVGNDLYVTYSGGTASWSGIKPNGSDAQMEFHVLSTKEFTANIVGQTPKYDLSMLNSPTDTDRIDGYSIYLSDSAADVYWKQETAVTNMGYVEFGKDDGTRTIYGKITDGTNPHCPDTPSANFVKKSGSGTVTLGNTASTYTLYTDIAGGTLSVAADGALGTAPSSAALGHLRISDAGAAFVATDTFTLNPNRGLLLSNWMYWGVADTKVNTYNGVITDGAGSYKIVKNQGGELVLGGNNAYDGGTYIDYGTLTLNHASAAGTGGLFVGMESGSLVATLNLGLAATYANTLTVRTGSTGIKYITAPETATLSGALTISEAADDRFTVDVASGKILTLSGVMSGAGGGKITKTGAGTLVFSNVGNTHDKKVQINEGILSLSTSRNLGADPGGIYENKLTLHGGMLQAAATFSLHANVGIALGVNNGLIDVGTYTLTVPAPIIGAGAFGKTGTGTLLLTGANTFTGPLTNSAGTVQIGNNGTAGSVSANIVNNAALVWNRSDNTTYGGVISGTGTLEKKGAGTLTLSGANTYSGNTTVSAGTLLVSGSLANSAVTVASGATLMGDGPLGSLTIGGLVDPGNSVGACAKLEAGAVTLQAGGSLRVDMSAATGTAGTDWDLITASGTIAVNSTGTFTIYPSGAPTGFDSSKSYEWTIMNGTVSGFNAARFAVDTSNFSHDLGGGSFSIDSGSLKLKFTPRTPDAPTAFSATATAADTIKLAFTQNSSSDPVVIVYNMTGTFSTPSGTVPAAGQTFAGGTVVYAGATSPQNHTGLSGCTKYYYAAWSYNGTTFSASGSTANETTDTPAAPTNVRASATNYTDFTAAWNAVSGATGYRLDVSLYEDFQTAGGGAAGSIYTVDFENETKGSYAPGDVDLNGISWNLDEATIGKLANDRFNGLYSVRVRSNETENSSGMLSMNADTNMGLSSITFYYAKYGTDADTAGRVDYSTNSGSTWTSAGTFDVISATLTLFTATNLNVSGDVRIRIVKTSGTTARYNIDDITLYPYGGGSATPSFVTGYEDLAVANTSVSVTGLAEETKYYFRVRSEGAGGCTSADSATEEVTTKTSTVEPPADFSATANGMARIDLTFATNAAQDNVVIVYNTTGVDDFTAPSGTPPAVGGSFAGGTLIYNGTGASYSHTGLDPCGTYFYRAFSYNVSGKLWSTGLDADAETDAPAAPETVWASAINYTDFTAAWDAVTGVSDYRIDVSTYSDFIAPPTGGGSESFESHNATGTYDDGNYTGDNGVKWYYVASRDEGLYPITGKGIMMRRTSDSSQIYSDGVLGGVGTFTCKLRKGFTGVGNRQVELFVNDVSKGTSMAWDVDDEVKTFTVTDINVSGVVTIRVDNITANQVVIDDISWTGFGSTEPSYVIGYEDRKVTGATSVSVTGLEEDTTYYFRVRAEGAENCQSEDSPTGSAKTKSSAVAPPEEFSATANGVAQIDLAFKANDSGDNVVIVYNTTGTFTAPSGTPPASGSFAGGTLIYNGTGTSYNHTGLGSCTPYYYRAFSYNGTESFWSTGSDDNAETDAPGTPTTVAASVINYTDFTAAWATVPGAASYAIDVSETATFAASGGDSTRLVLASNAATSVGAITDEWSGSDLAGTAYVMMIKPTSTVVSPAFSTVGFTNLTVDCKARTYGGVNATYNTITVSISTNNGVEWAVMGTIVPASSGLIVQPTLTHEEHLGHAETRIRWQTLGASGSVGAGVERLVVQGWKTSAGAAACLPSFDNLTVEGTSVSVTGLLEATTYYFRVRAVGDGGCISDSSQTASATTRSGSPAVPASVIASDGTSTTQVTVDWVDTATNAQGFVIWRHTLNTIGSATAIGTNVVGNTTYSDATAASGRLYYYWVTATNDYGTSARSDPDTGFRRLLPPTDTDASDGTSTEHVEITWASSDGATTYRVYRNMEDNQEGAADLGALSSGALDISAVPGQQYYY